VSRAVARNLVALLIGVLFGVGLVLAGMTQPVKVLGFLDWFGAWDPSLLFVIGGAIAVYSIAYRVVLQRKQPLLADAFVLPRRTRIDAKLIGGAALFGVGWGLGGYCPGPSIVSLGSGATDALVLVGATVAGMWIGSKLDASTAHSTIEQ
jgi:uncharacterized membrane protein YedE/YeeE